MGGALRRRRRRPPPRFSLLQERRKTRHGLEDKQVPLLDGPDALLRSDDLICDTYDTNQEVHTPQRHLRPIRLFLLIVFRIVVANKSQEAAINKILNLRNLSLIKTQQSKMLVVIFIILYFIHVRVVVKARI